MTARALIKSATAQRSSPSLTSPGASMPQLPNQSVQADGMRDRLPSGSTTNNNGTPRRVSPLITARRHPWKGWRLRVITTEVGTSWEWVVCGVFVGSDDCAEADSARRAQHGGDSPMRQRALDDEGLLARRQHDPALEDAAQPFDVLGRPMAEVEQRALPYPPAVPIALAQQDRRWGAAVGHGFDIHGRRIAEKPAQSTKISDLHGYTFHPSPAQRCAKSEA